MLEITKSKPFKSSVAIAAIVISTCFLMFRFYAMWWLIFSLIQLYILPVYLVAFFKSANFWIQNKKKYRHPFVPFTINVLTVLFVLLFPSTNRSRSYPQSTERICDWKHCA